ncbi:hypothetical protein ILUMI_22619 [Ignelater luminosus]|uniref:Uncharacterized protein n=1 Tax=Ignelater luminosus TaxID=2038154 RepID=A0A8K0CGS4_IGNLU|nr:hypothetical protein ILUMI_22619 [Ignelater luminosus]
MEATHQIIVSSTAGVSSAVVGQLPPPIVDYFEDTWIGRPGRRNKRRNPSFPHSLWNCYEATLEDLPKINNNSVEGWHREFSQLLGASHP